MSKNRLKPLADFEGADEAMRVVGLIAFLTLLVPLIYSLINLLI